MDRPVQRIAVEPVLERGRRPARQDRRAHEPLRPRDRPATGVEASGHAIVVVRAEHVMLHIFLAGPDDFHRPLDLFRDAHGLGDVVVFEAPTEPAAQQMVVYHDHLLGGGFGRRLEHDYVTQAVRIAKQVEGPVKIIWTREEDVQHDVFRPYYYDRMAAGLDAGGRPIAWTQRLVGPSILARWAPPAFKNGLDGDALDGAVHLLYDIPAIQVEYVRHERSEERR